MCPPASLGHFAGEREERRGIKPVCRKHVEKRQGLTLCGLFVTRVDRGQDFSSDGVFSVQRHRCVSDKVHRSGAKRDWESKRAQSEQRRLQKLRFTQLVFS